MAVQPRFLQPIRLGIVALVALAVLVSQIGFSSAGGPDEGIFDRGTLDLDVVEPTALTMGPDGRLYVASSDEILAATLDPDTHEVLAVEQIAADVTLVLGLAFDHTAPPEAPLKLYAARQDTTGVEGYWGRVTTYTAPNWTPEDIIVNLPSSMPLLNHMTNGLDFDDDGLLYIAQGSNTDSGFTREPPEYFPESPLSAAILVADVNAPGFNGNLQYDPPGTPIDHNVNLVSGDVEVYSPGHRNPYDIVIHKNGHLYAADNGSSGFDGPADCKGGTVFTSVSDELNLVEEGHYYGFPNLNRGRFEPRECAYRDPEEPSKEDYTAPIEVLPRHCSCNGIIDYHGPALGGEMNGDLIIARFSRNDLWRIQLSEDGRSVEGSEAVARNFDSPLDLTVGTDGTIFIAEYSDDAVSYLEPLPSTPTPTSEDIDTPTSPGPPTNTPEDTPTDTDTPTHTPTPEGVPGDANCSGATDSIDAALVLQFVAALIPNVGCPDLSDLNGDGNINAVDAAIILQINAGLI